MTRQRLTDAAAPGSSVTVDRRGFVRTAGGLLVVAAFGPGCADGVGSANTGMVRLRISGLLPGAASAGTAVVSGSGLQLLLIVSAASALGEAEVPVGEYRVRYLPPAGYTLTPGSANEATVVVNSGDLTEVTFGLVVASATLQVTVTGVGVGAASGGTASVQRIDLGNQQPVVSGVPASGTLTLSLIAGEYTVDYAAPISHQLVPGQVDPQSVTLLSNQTATIVYQLEVAVAPAGVVFHSDWGTALGSTDAALRDTGKSIPWDIVIGSSNPRAGRLVVVPATGLDFPSANVLQVDGIDIETIQTRQVSILPGSSRWPVPAVGESVWFRVYKRLAYPVPQYPALGNNNHALEERSGNASNWSFSFDVNEQGWRPKLQSQVATRYYLSDGSQAVPVHLARNVTYRLEWQVHRISDLGCNLHIRIFNSAGTLLYDDNDFFVNATQHLGQNPMLTLTDPQALDAWQLGTNGPGVNPSEDIVPMWYFGCAAVSRQNWVGPYSAGV